jgi:FkbM family methyltransferase
MKIMTVSNGRQWKTGYGNQINLFIPRMKAAGYEPVEFAFTDRNGAPSYRGEDETLAVMQRFDAWGNDVYDAHMRWTQADVSLGLFDFFIADVTAYQQHPHIQMAVVDSSPLRPDLAKALRVGARWVWAISRFGEQQLKDAGFECDYVPHGVDMKVYKPGDSAEARRLIQQAIDADEPEREYPVKLEDKFVVLMNSANNDNRKGFYEALCAWKEFHAAHPDSVLYLHTDMTGARGESIFDFMETAGVDPVGSVVYPNQYFYHMGMIGPETMADLYNAADVLLCPSYAEGFGIPIIESQACGTPVIVSDSSSMSELCYSGIKVPTVAPYPRHAGLIWRIPSIPGIVDALEKSYETAHAPQIVGPDEVGMWHANPRQLARLRVQDYDADAVFANYMLPALKRVEAELGLDRAKAAADHTHKWGKVGLSYQGQIVTPCLDSKCRAGKATDGRIFPNAFPPLMLNGQALEFEDDPEGGVSKIIEREVTASYHLDMVDLRPGDFAVDIGAHVGIVTCYLAKRFPDCAVVAYEPMDANFERLQHNRQANGVRDNTIAYAIAVTKDGRDVFMADTPGENTGGNNIYTSTLAFAPSITLNTIINVDHPALLKIDCEGAEYEILEGKTALLDGVRYVIGEFHINKQWPRARAEALIAELRKVVPNVWITICPVPNLPEGTNGHKPEYAHEPAWEINASEYMAGAVVEKPNHKAARRRGVGTN